MIFDDDYEHKLCFGLADFLCVRENQSQKDGKSFVSENSKSKVERVTEGKERKQVKKQCSTESQFGVVGMIPKKKKKKRKSSGSDTGSGPGPKEIKIKSFLKKK